MLLIFQERVHFCQRLNALLDNDIVPIYLPPFNIVNIFSPLELNILCIMREDCFNTARASNSIPVIRRVPSLFHLIRLGC